MPVATHQLLQEKINGQHLIGVTGGIACGKTTTIANFRSFLLATFGFETHVIVVDQLLRDLYADRESRDCQRIRRELAKRFGSQVLTADGFDVNRAFLAKKLMDGSPEASAHLRFVEELTMPAKLVGHD